MMFGQKNNELDGVAINNSVCSFRKWLQICLC